MPVEPKAPDATPDFAKMFADLQTSISTTVNNGINALDKRLKALEDKSKTPEGTPPVDPDVTPTPDSGDKGPIKGLAALNAQIAQLTRQNETLSGEVKTERTARENAEKAKKDADLKASFNSALGEMEFPTAKSKKQFHDAYFGRVEMDEAGNYVIKDDKGAVQDMAAFLKAEYEESTHLIPYQHRGGTGVTPGVNGNGAAKPFSFDPNMTPAQVAALSESDQAAYRANLHAVLSANA